MKILIVLIIAFILWDLLDMAINKKKSKYVRIRNSIFDVVQLFLIGLKLLNYSGLTLVVYSYLKNYIKLII